MPTSLLYAEWLQCLAGSAYILASVGALKASFSASCIPPLLYIGICALAWLALTMYAYNDTTMKLHKKADYH